MFKSVTITVLRLMHDFRDNSGFVCLFFNEIGVPILRKKTTLLTWLIQIQTGSHLVISRHNAYGKLRDLSRKKISLHWTVSGSVLDHRLWSQIVWGQVWILPATNHLISRELLTLCIFHSFMYNMNSVKIPVSKKLFGRKLVQIHETSLSSAWQKLTNIYHAYY